jgi:hypothetical protein
MEGIQKIMEEVKVMRFQKGDILIVKLDNKYSPMEKNRIADHLKKVIPPDLQVQVIISTPDTEFEILRRGPQVTTQVNG